MLVDSGTVDPAQLEAEFGRIDQADGDRFAVGQFVVGRDLQRVRQGVAVVQQRSTPTLTLVGRDDLGLDLDAPSDAFLEFHGEQVVAGEEVVLRHLAETATHLAGR